MDKHTFAVIGIKLGKTKNAVIGKSHRLGLVSLSGAKNRYKQSQPDTQLKSDKMVLAQIKRHTDKYGWGLELSEIVEYTKLPLMVVIDAIKRLMGDGYINKITSHVAGHVFYNNALVKQIEYS